MPRFAPYAAHEIAMLSTIPGTAGSGLPIGLMPGALPSDQASSATLKTTAIRLPPGHSQSTCSIAPLPGYCVAGRPRRLRLERIHFVKPLLQFGVGAANLV